MALVATACNDQMLPKETDGGRDTKDVFLAFEKACRNRFDRTLNRGA